MNNKIHSRPRKSIQEKTSKCKKQFEVWGRKVRIKTTTEMGDRRRNKTLRAGREKQEEECRVCAGTTFQDKSPGYIIWFPALQMKANAPALQSDQPCVSPLLPLAWMIFSSTMLNDAHCQALSNKQWYKPLSTIGWSSFSCVLKPLSLWQD